MVRGWVIGSVEVGYGWLISRGFFSFFLSLLLGGEFFDSCMLHGWCARPVGHNQDHPLNIGATMDRLGVRLSVIVRIQPGVFLSVQCMDLGVCKFDATA